MLHDSTVVDSKHEQCKRVDNDRAALKLAEGLIPDATLICCDLVNLYNVLKLPVLPFTEVSRIVLGGIQFSLEHTPISQATTKIFGIDITVKAPITFPIETERPKELGFKLELLERFVKHRDLQCFIMILNPASAIGPNKVDLEIMFSRLDKWKILSEYVDCAQIGDAIGANRVVIIGIHPLALGSLPEIAIAKRRVPNLSVILDHINIEMNTKICALGEIHEHDLIETNAHCPTRSPRPIAIANSKHTSTLDNRDLILHPAYPGVECKTSENDRERQSFLIPYICTLTGKYYVRALHSSEVVALYTSNLAPALRQQIHQQMMGENACGIVQSSCPWIW